MQPLNILISSLPRFTLTGPENPAVTGLTADSRAVEAGNIFVAYKGVSVDGHRFVEAAIKRGASVIVAEADSGVVVPPKVTCLTVPDGREALAHLASAWYGHPGRKMTMIGITGTDGKTSTTNLIYAILKRAGKKVGMISTVNAVIGDEFLETGLHTTTPDSLDTQRYLAQMVAAGTEICLLEVTSHGLAQHRVTACNFDWAVVTNITHEHLDIHGSLEAYRLAKARLFEMAETGAVLNADDWSFAFLTGKIDPQLPIISYGIENHSNLQAANISLRPDATIFEVELNGQPHTVETPLVGAFNISNILAALAVTVTGLGISAAAALEALRRFNGVPGRMERIDCAQAFTAIVDFAHSPNALRRALEAVRPLTQGRVIAVFGCAGLRDVEKRTLMGQVAAQLADLTIITAEDPRTEDLDSLMAVTADAMREQGATEGDPSGTGPTFLRVPDRGWAIYKATQLARPGDIVIALGKGHEQSMCFGSTEYPWDDREAMRSALKGEPLLTLPTAGEET